VQSLTERAVNERAMFFRPPATLFGVRHVPQSDCIGGLVICSPLLAEFVRNYRREVELARALALRGVAVHRFHYYGSGRSWGDSFETTMESMVSDALAAASELGSDINDRPIAFLGTRVGAVVAAAAAARFPGAPVAMWEPTADTRKYWREAFRARLMYELKEGSGRKLTDDSLLTALNDDGFIDVIGYQIDKHLYESVVASDLSSSINAPRPVLLVDINRSKKLAPAYSALSDEWRNRGCQVATHVLGGQEAWWFAAAGRREDEARVPTDELLNLTVEWLIEELQ
jgi:pimeloyl-ACP methyl ester carboxylesterase